MLDLADRGRRTSPARRAPQRSLPPEPDPTQLVALVSRMRAGDALTTVRRGAANGRSGTLDTLRRAAERNLTVWLGFVDGHGVAGERVLEPLSVGGGVVEGRDPADGGVLRVPLHRITSIALVED